MLINSSSNIKYFQNFFLWNIYGLVYKFIKSCMPVHLKFQKKSLRLIYLKKYYFFCRPNWNSPSIYIIHNQSLRMWGLFTARWTVKKSQAVILDSLYIFIIRGYGGEECNYQFHRISFKKLLFFSWMHKIRVLKVLVFERIYNWIH